MLRLPLHTLPGLAVPTSQERVSHARCTRRELSSTSVLGITCVAAVATAERVFMDLLLNQAAARRFIVRHTPGYNRVGLSATLVLQVLFLLLQRQSQFHFVHLCQHTLKRDRPEDGHTHSRDSFGTWWEGEGGWWLVLVLVLPCGPRTLRSH